MSKIDPYDHDDTSVAGDGTLMILQPWRGGPFYQWFRTNDDQTTCTPILTRIPLLEYQ